MSKKDKSAEILKRCRRIYDNEDTRQAEPLPVFPSIVEEQHATEKEHEAQNNAWVHVPASKADTSQISTPDGYGAGTYMPPHKNNEPAILKSYSGYDKSNLENIERSRKDDGTRITKRTANERSKT